MIVSTTTFQNNVEKYLALSKREDVIITKNKKRIAKIVAIEKSATPNVDALLELLEKTEKEDTFVTHSDIREERLKDYESLT